MDVLPNELLQEIMKFTVNKKPPCLWVDNMTLVCSRWKSAALGYPTLWTNIETASCTLGSLSRQLFLSGDLPIQVCFNGRRITEDPQFVDVLLRHAHRISTLRFEPENVGAEAHIVRQGDEVFISRPAFGNLDTGAALDSLLRGCSSLHDLALIDIVVPWDTGAAGLIRSLTRLELDLWEEAPLGPLLIALSQCPRIEELVLMRSSPSDHDYPALAPTRTVALPQLRYLSIFHYPCCVSWFLDHIIPPERVIVDQRSTIDVRLGDKSWTSSVPAHNKANWAIYSRARYLRLQLPDEYHIMLDACSTVKSDPNDPVEDGPHLEMNFHQYGTEWKVQHLLVTAVPDIADMFSEAPISHLIIDAYELEEGLRLADPSENLDDVHFTPETWHATLSKLPLLEYLELRERNVVKQLFQALSKPRGGDGALLCPRLHTIVLAMDSFDKETISAIFMSCAFRASQGMRLNTLSFKAFDMGSLSWTVHVDKLQAIVERVVVI